jgi:hypothetical protein
MDYYHNITFCDCPYVSSHYTTCWSCGKFPLRSPVVKPSPRAAAKSARRTPRNKRCRAFVLHTAIQHRYGLGHIANQPSVPSLAVRVQTVPLWDALAAQLFMRWCDRAAAAPCVCVIMSILVVAPILHLWHVVCVNMNNQSIYLLG